MTYILILLSNKLISMFLYVGQGIWDLHRAGKRMCDHKKCRTRNLELSNGSMTTLLDL